MTRPSRRQFLVGAAGATLPLPLLSSLWPRGAHASGVSRPVHPLIVVRAASGVAQEDGEDPDLFWPGELGGLTQSSLAERDGGQVVSELAEYAERLLMVRGTSFPFKATKELHAGGGNQLLTAARCGPISDSVMTYAMGESIDNWIARRSEVNGGEPLTLYAGQRLNYGEEVLSYRGPELLRGAESDPWKVYTRLIGGNGEVGLRTSINDLVLDQLHGLLSHPRLSLADRERLELHTDSVRDFEVMGSRLSAETEARMEELDGRSEEDEVVLDVAKLHCDLVALVFATDMARAATLQMGDRLDRARYTVDGELLPQYHELTHRILPAGYPQAFAHPMHAAINRLHLGVYRHLLRRLEERGLLETSVAVFTSDLATGNSHSYVNIPWIVAGQGDGSLRQGAYVDAGDVTHDRLLVTLLHATGHRQAGGEPIEQFGDESLAGGLLDVMLS
jgi:hypothetical protein